MHYATCNRAALEVQARHRAVQRAWLAAAREYGMIGEVSPPDPARYRMLMHPERGPTQLRTDVLFRGDDDTKVFLDFSITSANSASHRDLPVEVVLNNVVNSKMNKHRTMVEEMPHSRFLPVVYEAHGGTTVVAQAAMLAVAGMIDMGALARQGDGEAFRRKLGERVAVALARSDLEISLNNYNRAMQHPAPAYANGERCAQEALARMGRDRRGVAPLPSAIQS